MEITEELLTKTISTLDEVVEHLQPTSKLGWKVWTLKLQLDNYRNSQQEDTS